MPSKRKIVRCLACRKPIQGKPCVMRLHITHQQPRLLDAARTLGFTSLSRREGDYMEVPFHNDRFRLAGLIWQIAFDTRGLSPRR